MPSPSSTSIGFLDEIVSRFFPLASSTRIEVDGRLAERRAGVVGREDLVVRVALLRVALGAPLAHADAVPVAVAADEEERAGAGRRDVLRDLTSGAACGVAANVTAATTAERAASERTGRL